MTRAATWTPKLLARFWSRIDLQGADRCWTWTTGLNWEGYGCLRFPDTTRLAHRLAYELLVGPIPDGLVIDHLCRNRRCVNPDHMEPVTNRENILRGVGITARAAQAIACPKGHPYTPENTYRRHGDGFRECRACRAAHERQRTIARRHGQAFV